MGQAQRRPLVSRYNFGHLLSHYMAQDIAKRLPESERNPKDDRKSVLVDGDFENESETLRPRSLGYYSMYLRKSRI